MEKISLVFLMTMTYMSCFAQISHIKEVNNDNIKYDIGFVTLDDERGLIIEYQVFMVDENLHIELFKLTKSELMDLLTWFNCEDKDWAVNILLYARFNKNINAPDFFPKYIWRISGKKSDLKYWRKTIENLPD